jgi:hypothetical protein
VTHSTPTQAIGGFVAPGFEGVAEAFERNFAERDELGAALYAMKMLRDDEDEGGRGETLLRSLHEAVS